MAETETRDNATETKLGNPSDGREGSPGEKPKVVVIMGPTGSGKSKLAIDLASHFAVEVINADSMQVYKGLDVLTNKVTMNEQKGVRHHLLGTVSPNVEFTAKEFRDSAIPVIDDILSRNCLPVIVGGTHYYIQALISTFLLDDTVEDLDDDCVPTSPGEAQPSIHLECEEISDSFERLKAVDPVAANRIHPNNHRKISQYLNLYARSGILPSELLQGKAAENWGRVGNFRYNCCFISIDTSLPVLDRHVDRRVECMVDSGLLNEVYDMFNVNADYTRGLLQAIGVREFETVLRDYVFEAKNDDSNCSSSLMLANMKEILESSDDSKAKTHLIEAIDRVKLNTRRLVRRQRRMISRLQKLFKWDIHVMDATDSISSNSDVIWSEQVVGPATEIVKSFLNEEATLVPSKEEAREINETKLHERALWTQYECEACGNKVLRGSYEWEQHKRGRNHRKRLSKLRKSQGSFLTKQLQNT